MNKLLLMIALPLLVTFSSYGQKVYSTVSQSKIEDLLDDMGIQHEEVKEDILRVYLGDFTAYLSIKSGGEDLRLVSFFIDQGVSMSDCNEWNKTMRFSQAYIDDDGDCVFSSDMDLAGGVSLDNVEAFVKLYMQLLNKFQEHIQ